MKKAELFHPVVFEDEKWAQGYYKRNKKNIEKFGKRYAEILKKSGFKSGRILDSGCGFGAVAMELGKAFPDAEIVGVDLGEPVMDIGRQLLKSNGLNHRVILKKGDVCSLEFDTDSFDVVVNSFMLHLVDSPQKMLNEIERTAKPGAKIILSDLRRMWMGVLIRKLATALTVEEARDIIGSSNIRKGVFMQGFYWWDYLAGIQAERV